MGQHSYQGVLLEEMNENWEHSGNQSLLSTMINEV
jgi:hypothetical protein